MHELSRLLFLLWFRLSVLYLSTRNFLFGMFSLWYQLIGKFMNLCRKSTYSLFFFLFIIDPLYDSQPSILLLFDYKKFCCISRLLSIVINFQKTCFTRLEKIILVNNGFSRIVFWWYRILVLLNGFSFFVLIYNRFRYLYTQCICWDFLSL